MDILDQIKALGNGTIGLDEAEEMELLYAAGVEIERLRTSLTQLMDKSDKLADDFTDQYQRAEEAKAEIERLRAHNEVLIESVTALRALENACDRRCGARPRSVYEAELGAGMGEVLTEMEHARGRARVVLRACDDIVKSSQIGTA